MQQEGDDDSTFVKVLDKLQETLVNDNTSDETITLSQFLDALSEYSFYVLILLFSIPTSIPMPAVPGYTTLWGFPVLLFTIQVMLGYEAPSLPKPVGQKNIKKKYISSIIRKALPCIKFIEKMLRQRMVFLFTKKIKLFVTILMTIGALCVVIPLPFTNFLPSAGIAIISLGVMMSDGLAVIVGSTVTILGVALTIVILIISFIVVMSL